MNDLPPKTVKAQLVRLDDSLKQIERTQVAGIQRAPGSLPVLEAFQQFLENENRKARRRMALLTVFAVCLFIAVAGTGLWMVRSYLNEAAVELEAVDRRADELEAALSLVEARTEQHIKALETRFSEEGERIAEDYRTLIAEQDAPAQAWDEQAEALEGLSHRLQRLEEENEQLREQWMAAIGDDTTTQAPERRWGLFAGRRGNDEESQTQDVPLASESATELLAESNAIRSTEDETAVLREGTIATDDDASDSQEVSPIVVIVDHPKQLLMTVRPKGYDAAIRWQLPRHLILE